MLVNKNNKSIAALLGINNFFADTYFIDRLKHLTSSFRISEFVFVKTGGHNVDVDAKAASAAVDFVLVHCETYTCYKIVKKVGRVVNAVC